MLNWMDSLYSMGPCYITFLRSALSNKFMCLSVSTFKLAQMVSYTATVFEIRYLKSASFNNV